MKTIIWIIIAIIVIGGVAWFLSSDNNPSDDTNNQNTADQLSENGRTLNTDENVFSEIDEALGALE